MDIYSILSLIGGLAFFLYGISIMSAGLEKVAGGKLEKLLKKMTSNRVKGLLLGTGITAVIQSSAATTIMLIGLVNSGLMDLSQTISVIFGTNIGTTITAWILSLSGINGDASFLLTLVKPETFTPILAFIGVCMIMVAKSNKNKSIGSIMVGFAVLMYGMILMSGSMAPLSHDENFRNLMVAFTNPALGFMVGLILTLIIQSSSASIGILQALSMVGGVSWAVAIPIIMGQNLGACLPTVIASIGVGTNAKRVAAVHVIYNIIGVVAFFPLFYGANMIFKFAFMPTDISPVGIAIFHTTYNVVLALSLFGFMKMIENLAIKYVPESKREATKKIFLEERLLNTPSLAISECFLKTIEMAEIVQHNYVASTKMLKSFHKKMAEEILENEERIDAFEDYLNSYLLKLSGCELTEEDNNKIVQIMLTISDFERIGDHASHILKYAEKLHEPDINFSDEAIDEIKTIVSAVSEIYDMALECYKTDNLELAQKIEPLEAVIKKGVKRAKNNHIHRLQTGQCSAERSFIFSDLLNDLRRIAAHCGNIATSVIQLHDITINKHEYNHRNKDEDMEFKNRYKDYKSRYKVIKRNKETVTQNA